MTPSRQLSVAAVALGAVVSAHTLSRLPRGGIENSWGVEQRQGSLFPARPVTPREPERPPTDTVGLVANPAAPAHVSGVRQAAWAQAPAAAAPTRLASFSAADRVVGAASDGGTTGLAGLEGFSWNNRPTARDDTRAPELNAPQVRRREVEQTRVPSVEAERSKASGLPAWDSPSGWIVLDSLARKDRPTLQFLEPDAPAPARIVFQHFPAGNAWYATPEAYLDAAYPAQKSSRMPLGAWTVAGTRAAAFRARVTRSNGSSERITVVLLPWREGFLAVEHSAPAEDAQRTEGVYYAFLRSLR